jgi:hypothetical protein
VHGRSDIYIPISNIDEWTKNTNTPVIIGSPLPKWVSDAFLLGNGDEMTNSGVKRVLIYVWLQENLPNHFHTGHEPNVEAAWHSMTWKRDGKSTS